jgi:hypothetical protein
MINFVLISVALVVAHAADATTATTASTTQASVFCPLVEAAVIAKATLAKNESSPCFNTQLGCEQCAVAQEGKCAYCPNPVIYVSGQYNGAAMSLSCPASTPKNGWCWQGTLFSFVSPISAINIDAKNSLTVVVYCDTLPNWGQCALGGTALVALAGAAIFLVLCCFCGVLCLCVCRSRRNKGYARV